VIEMGTEHRDIVVIGAGQAGLALGHHLAAQGRDFVVLEAASRVGEAWRSRWDSLRLFTTARYSALPGMRFPAPEDSFPTKAEMADYLEHYAARFALPVRLDTRVARVERHGERYSLDLGGRRVTAGHVVVATGPFQHPARPAFAGGLGRDIAQLHSRDYRAPGQLPDGDVLVVGAGNSGAEIAVELARSGRRVWLAGRDTGHIPQALVNSAVFSWAGRHLFTTERWVGRRLQRTLAGRGDPLVRLTAARIREAGVIRVPRTTGVAGGRPRLADGRTLDVAAVVWATGYRPDFRWLSVPGIRFREDGYPAQERGAVVGEQGLHVLGMPFQPALLSATIRGVDIDARHVAARIHPALATRGEDASLRRAS
jgi:putative flavoprotein involved in K+ transport